MEYRARARASASWRMRLTPSTMTGRGTGSLHLSPLNAYSQGGTVVIDVCVSARVHTNADGSRAPADFAVRPRLERWTFDLAAEHDQYKRAALDDLATRLRASTTAGRVPKHPARLYPAQSRSKTGRAVQHDPVHFGIARASAKRGRQDRATSSSNTLIAARARTKRTDIC